MSLRTVVLVAPHYPPHLGGVEQYVSQLGRELLRSGRAQRVVVVTASADDGTTPQVPGLVVHRLRTRFTVSNTPIGTDWVRRLREIVAAEQPDVVNAHAPVPLLGDLAGLVVGDRPFVLTYHTGPMRKGSPATDLALRGYENLLLRRTARRADAVVCGSTYVHDSLRHVLGPVAEIISAGVDATLFHPAQQRPANRVLFVGSLYGSTRYKGLDTLLDAVKAMHDSGQQVHLDVAGDGDARDWYAQRCVELGIDGHVDFLGSLDREQVAAAYRTASVVALPSRFDSVPTALVEAMASGLPVVASEVGGIPELVQDGRTGLLVPPGDPAGLAAALTRVVLDPDLGDRLGAAGREDVECRLSWTAQAARTADVFERAVLLRRGRPGRARVAVVTPYYAPRTGGVESYSRHVAAALQASDDLDAVVVTTRRGVRTVVDEVDDVPVVRVGAWFRLSNTPVGPLWPWQLRRMFRRYRVDAVHAHSPVPVFADAAALAAGRRPYLLTYHSGSLLKGGPVDVVLRAYEKHVLPRLFARADGLVAVSPASLAWSTGRAEMVTPGVDVDRFRPPQPQPTTDGGPADRPAGRDPVLLYVGRLERSSAWKGVHVLVEALPAVLAQRPDAVLEVVGEGDSRSDLAALAERLGVADRVRFRGALTGDDLVEAYRRAAAVVLPSLTEAESFGIVLVEAMACRTPVVASRVGGVPYVVRDGVDGLLVPPGDVASLADACVRVLTDAGLAARLGAAGREAAVERFTWAAGTARTADLLRGLVGLPVPGVRTAPGAGTAPDGDAVAVTTSGGR